MAPIRRTFDGIVERLLLPHRAPWLMGALCAATLCVGGACSEHEVRDPFHLGDPVQVEITGADYRWLIRYAGPDGRLGTADDRAGEGDLHLPLGYRCDITLLSHDYVYTLELPAWGTKQIAVPDMAFEMEVVPANVGRSPLRGDEMCGIDHPHLRASVHVHGLTDYERVILALPRIDAAP